MKRKKKTRLTWKTALLHQLLFGHHLHCLEAGTLFFYHSSAMKLKSPRFHSLVRLLYFEGRCDLQGAGEHDCHNRDESNAVKLKHIHLKV